MTDKTRRQASGHDIANVVSFESGDGIGAPLLAFGQAYAARCARGWVHRGCL